MRNSVNMTARDRSATLAKGLAVLACFQSGARDLTMADVARQTGLDRAVARRLCLTLEAEGLLTRSGKFLRLTPKVLALAGGYLSAEGIGQRVQPVLNQCAEDLHGEIALAVLEGERCALRGPIRSGIRAALLWIFRRLNAALSAHSGRPDAACGL